MEDTTVVQPRLASENLGVVPPRKRERRQRIGSILHGIDYRHDAGRSYRSLVRSCAKSDAARGDCTDSVDWTVRVWAASKQFFPVKERLSTVIKEQLARNKIQVAFQQIQLHLSEDNALVRPSRHSGLPIPKMSTPQEGRGTSVRPRPRE